MKNKKLRKGTLLLCLQDHYDQFTKGKVYKCIGDYTFHNDKRVRVVDDKGEENGWGLQYFTVIGDEQNTACKLLFDREICQKKLK